MHRWLVALALLAACRDDRPNDAGPRGSASVVSALPKLPPSADGVAALRALDQRIEIHAKEPATLIALVLQRAQIRGRVEDYQRAVEESAKLVAATPADPAAWQLRVQALTAVHDFVGARDALEKLAPLIHPSHLVEPQLGIDEATGEPQVERRLGLAKERPSPARWTLYAASLAAAGRVDDAIAQIPTAVAAIRDNPPELLAWLLFQWGRLYEQKGELATAKQFFAAAHARLPGYVDATAHLAQTMLATGDTTGVRALVDHEDHPELVALVDPVAARVAWERYVAALPLAFSDHAARFYLGPGNDPKRALDLANVNFQNRATRDARALVVEAALAAGDARAACAVVDPLTSGIRAHRFVAWRAFSQCGRGSEADRLARELGIAH